MTGKLRYDPATNRAVVKATWKRRSQGRPRLSEAERQQRKAAQQAEYNAAMREAVAVPYCHTCGIKLVDCQCKPYDARPVQVRDVVVTLNVRTMRRKVEIR